jgi:hypothetical protein
VGITLVNPLFRQRHNHADLPAVAPVVVAVHLDQIALL